MDILMSREDKLQHAIEGVSRPVYLSNKADIVEYLKDTYGKKWTSVGAELRSGTSDTKSREYKSAQRSFQGGREHSTPRTAADKESWSKIGRQLPSVSRELKPGKDSITITVQGDQKNGKRGGTRPRTIEVTFSGPSAHDFINNPNFPDIWDEYFDGGSEVMEDGDYEVEVTGVSAS
jgi:hypothetical protein